MAIKKNFVVVSLFIIFPQIMLGCAFSRAKPDVQESELPESPDPQKVMNSLNERILNLESKITSLNDKLDATRKNLDQLASNQRPSAIIPHPSEESGTSLSSKQAPHDPDAGFMNDEAIQNFRKAMIIYEGQKYPEATLAFSGFLEKNPDHPLAGSAQFYIGECYFNQKQYKLALQEYQRVLTSYDRSTHVADTLHKMTLAEENLKKSDKAGQYKQLLTSLFPQSPAAVSSKMAVEAEKAQAKEMLTHEIPMKEIKEAKETSEPKEASAANSRLNLEQPLTAPMENSEVEDQNKVLTPNPSTPSNSSNSMTSSSPTE